MASKSRITDTFPQRKTRSAASSSKPYTKTKPAKKAVAKPSTSKKDVDEDQNTLKEFDLNWEYGPCMGITRMERWKRADKHGLNPPESVKDMIEQHQNEKSYTECLWHDYNIL